MIKVTLGDEVKKMEKTGKPFPKLMQSGSGVLWLMINSDEGISLQTDQGTPYPVGAFSSAFGPAMFDYTGHVTLQNE